MRADREHLIALKSHEVYWNAMRRVGLTLGRDTAEYREARERMLVAHRRVREAARRARTASKRTGGAS